MKELNIKRELDDSTRVQGVWAGGEVYSMHITKENEVIITDQHDWSKIYSIQSLDFFNFLERVDIAELEGKDVHAVKADKTDNIPKQGEGSEKGRMCPNCGKKMNYEIGTGRHIDFSGTAEDYQLEYSWEGYGCGECKIVYDGVQWKVPDNMLPTEKQKKAILFINNRLDMDLEAVTKHQCWVDIGKYFSEAKHTPIADNQYNEDDFYEELQDTCGMDVGDFC